MPNRKQFRPGSQRGAVLIVALVLLLVLTVLGTAGIRDTAMEERMAGNFRDHAAALEAAETALRDGEGRLASTAIYNGMLFDGSDGTYEVLVTSHSHVPDDGSTHFGLSVDASVLTGGGELLVNAVPQYYIEKLPEIELPSSDLTRGFQDQAPRVHYYRVTSKAKGISPRTEVILQSTYFR